MIQIYADDAKVWNAELEREVFQNGVLIYDSRLEEYDLVGLTVTTGLNVGGTAEIVMPSDHPAYSTFQPFKTLVRIYRDGMLRFRGRVLYPSDNFLGQRTITCEGELCLLRDSIYRPYKKVGATPKSFFTTMINAHNDQADVAKRFTVGVVDVSSDVIEMENENAEPVLDALANLVEMVGGYITFTDAEDGTRVINWLSETGAESGQVIEFGENLLDFSSTGANTTELATGIIPYGAKIEYVDYDTGELVKTNDRITIKDAANSGGKDYILNGDAVYERGVIMMTKVWDDVKTANELYNKALAYLEEAKPWLFITSLELTALDLSYMDKSIDSFTVGDMILVVSAPHGVNSKFQLTQMTEDLLNPAQSKITLGKDVPSLTGADVAGDRKAQAGVNSVRTEVHGVDLTIYATKDELGGYATNDTLAGYVVKDTLNDYATKGDLNDYATVGDLSNYATKSALQSEANARAGVINKVSGVVQISGGAPINMLGGKIDIHGSEVNIGGDEGVTHLYGNDRIKVHNRMHLVGSMLDFDNNEGVRCYNNDDTVVYVLRIDPNNNTIVGTANNKTYIRGTTVYYGASNSVVTSDRRAKHSIEELPDAYVEALDKMTPVRFKYNDGTSDRYHVGFIAQDVEGALTEAGLCGKDFGGFVDVNGDGETLGLAYDEFIGLLFAKIRKLEQKIEKMESDNR